MCVYVYVCVCVRRPYTAPLAKHLILYIYVHIFLPAVNHIEPYHDQRNLHNMSFDTARSERERNDRNLKDRDPVMNRLAEGRTPLQSPLPKDESPKFTRINNRQNGNGCELLNRNSEIQLLPKIVKDCFGIQCRTCTDPEITLNKINYFQWEKVMYKPILNKGLTFNHLSMFFLAQKPQNLYINSSNHYFFPVIYFHNLLLS